MLREQQIDQDVRDGMARAIWVHAYMMWATAVDAPPQIYGDTWESAAPDTAASRRASGHAALELSELIGQMNHLGDWPMSEIFSRVRWPRGWTSPNTDMAYMLGQEVARICMGVLDRHDSLLANSRFAMPHLQAELSDDGRELTWDGGAARVNPGEGPPAILHLEDDPKIVAGTTRLLKKIFKDVKDVRIVPADNVDAAIANVGVHNVRLIISDVDVIGNKTGLDFFEWVKENRPDLVDRFVFFTGNSAAEGVHYRYLPKGMVTHEDLAAVIKAPAPGAAPRARETQAPPARAKARTTRAPKIVELPVAATRATGLEGLEMPIEQFAQAVHDALPTIQAEPGLDDPRQVRGRFGGKVFIDAVIRKLGQNPRFQRMTRAEIKERLIEAMRAQQLKLARADLVAAMDSTEVSESEIDVDGAARYHFVVDPRGGQSRDSSVSDEEFVGIVRDALPHIREQIDVHSGKPRGRYGRDNVFISAIWRQIQNDPRVAGMTRAEFDRRLVKANQEQRLILVRADLIDDMDPYEVEDSNISHLGTTFNFVVDRAPRRAAESTRDTFASDVLQIVKSIRPSVGATGLPRGRFGANKVFIGSVWRQASGLLPFAGMTREEFNRRLIAALRDGHLLLARADSVGDMDTPEVMDSEITDRGASFHFILDPSVRGFG